MTTPVSTLRSRPQKSPYPPESNPMRTVLQYLLLYAVTITWPVVLKAKDRWPSYRGPKGNNQRLYFTTMLGTVYVIDGTADTFDEHALLSVNDLGSPGRTWTLSPITPAGGRLYQRTSREIICIGQ